MQYPQESVQQTPRTDQIPLDGDKSFPGRVGNS